MRVSFSSEGTHFTVTITPRSDGYDVRVNGHPHRVDISSWEGETLAFFLDGHPRRAHIVRNRGKILVSLDGRIHEFQDTRRAGGETRESQRSETVAAPQVRSPMPGKILAILVSAGERVEIRHPLLILEAMKMENTLTAEGTGVVRTVFVRPGDMVEGGQLLLDFEEVQP